MARNGFEAVVRDYIGRFRERRQRERRWFAIQRSLEDAILRAAMAVSLAGERLNHQRRIPKNVLRHWADMLLEHRGRLQPAETFEELHDILTALAADLRGIGQLAIYDTAVRLGAFIGVEPERVYLHAGTREGGRPWGSEVAT